LPGQQS